MDNYNLFSDFGFDDDMDFFQVAGTEKKKAVKKEAQKEKPKKATDNKNAAQDVEIELPVKVVGRNCCITFGENGKKKLSQVADELVKMGFVELTIKGVGLELSQGSKNVLYMVENNVREESASSLVFEDEEQTVTVADGEIRAQFSVSDFDEEMENITCQILADKWSEINAGYKGCRLARAKDIYYPVMAEKADSKETSVMVTFAGCTVQVDKSDEKSDFKSAIKEACKEYWPEDVDVKICGGNDSFFFVTYQGKQGKKASYYKNGMDKTVAKKGKQEETYVLPFTLRVPNWNMDYEMTLEMFPGKQSVTKEEVKKKMAEIAPMFGDQSRKIDFCFFPEHNLMSAMFYSGSKGAVAVSATETDFYEKAHVGSVKLIRTMEELACVKKLNHFIGVMNEESPFKILALPHGNFYGYFGKELECCTVKKVVFERKLPLIPKHILEEVISCFRKDLSKEACVRILYQKNTGEFLVVEAKGERTKTNIFYDFSDVAPLMMQPEMICVMEIHSHNTMRAFFSSVDDEDEQYPGVFGVIGCLDKEPQMLFRARLDGVSSQPIPVAELFEA